MQGIRVGIWGIGARMWGIALDRNKRKRKKVYKIQSFFPEIKKKIEIRIVIKH